MSIHRLGPSPKKKMPTCMFSRAHTSNQNSFIQANQQKSVSPMVPINIRYLTKSIYQESSPPKKVSWHVHSIEKVTQKQTNLLRKIKILESRITQVHKQKQEFMMKINTQRNQKQKQLSISLEAEQNKTQELRTVIAKLEKALKEKNNQTELRQLKHKYRSLQQRNEELIEEIERLNEKDENDTHIMGLVEMNEIQPQNFLKISQLQEEKQVIQQSYNQLHEKYLQLQEDHRSSLEQKEQQIQSLKQKVSSLEQNLQSEEFKGCQQCKQFMEEFIKLANN